MSVFTEDEMALIDSFFKLTQTDPLAMFEGIAEAVGWTMAKNTINSGENKGKVQGVVIGSGEFVKHMTGNLE